MYRVLWPRDIFAGLRLATLDYMILPAHRVRLMKQVFNVDTWGELYVISWRFFSFSTLASILGTPS